jgi:cell division septal protein FtsQ
VARRTYEGTGMLPGMEEAAPAPASSKPRVRTPAPPKSNMPSPRVILGILAAAIGLVMAMYVFHRVELFFIGDPRFALLGPGDAGNEESLELVGASHASPRVIEAVFSADFGRSVYLIPLSDRRNTLRTVDWIKDAKVARLWPNRVVVTLTERKPVAFVTLAAGRVALIDEDGVILPRAKDRFNVPVLAGVHANDPLSERREHVQRMLALMRALGDEGQKVSEIDVTDRDNLKVSEPFDGRSVTLLLGDRNFAVRHQNFLDHFAEIKQRLPGAATLDLRLEDRITVVE